MTRRGDVTFEPVKVQSRWSAVMLALLILVALSLPALYVYEVYGYSRFEYRVTTEGIEARYGLVNIRVPAGEIAAVSLVEDPGSLSRTAGTGLPQVQRGWWTSSTLGRVYRLTTSGSLGYVLVETTPDARTARAGTRYLFSPADPEEFVRLAEAVRRGDAGVLGGQAERSFPPVPTAQGSVAFSWPMLLLLLDIPLIAGLVWFVVRGRRSLLYRVGPRGISVRHLFGWHHFRWDRIRDIRRLQGVRAVRVIGAALPGYFAGTFHARGMGSLRVYATDLHGDVILIEGAGGSRVVISPADVDGFLAAAAQHRR